MQNNLFSALRYCYTTVCSSRCGMLAYGQHLLLRSLMTLNILRILFCCCCLQYLHI